MKPKNTARWKKRQRLAVSEVIGAVILIGVTMSLGFAAWAWARTAATSSEGTIQRAATESFEIVNVNFNSTSSGQVTIWLYDSGGAPVYISAIEISNSTWTYVNSTLSSAKGPACVDCFLLNAGQISSTLLNVKTSFKVGVLYTIKAVGEYGTVYPYEQVR